MTYRKRIALLLLPLWREGEALRPALVVAEDPDVLQQRLGARAA